MTCRFFRLMISLAADSGDPVGRLTGRHLARCASCRRFQEACRVIEETLQSGAARHAPASGQFTGRVFSRLADSPRSNRGRVVRVALAVAACIAVAAAAAVFLTRPATRPAEPSKVTITAFVPPDADLEAAWTRLVERPLADEARSLTNDTQSGIRFLVACLDVSPAYNATDGPPR
jgi:hypothetical protein